MNWQVRNKMEVWAFWAVGCGSGDCSVIRFSHVKPSVEVIVEPGQGTYRSLQQSWPNSAIGLCWWHVDGHTGSLCLYFRSRNTENTLRSLQGLCPFIRFGVTMTVVKTTLINFHYGVCRSCLLCVIGSQITFELSCKFVNMVCAFHSFLEFSWLLHYSGCYSFSPLSCEINGVWLTWYFLCVCVNILCHAGSKYCG